MITGFFLKHSWSGSQQDPNCNTSLHGHFADDTAGVENMLWAGGKLEINVRERGVTGRFLSPGAPLWKFLDPSDDKIGTIGDRSIS